MSAEDSAEGSGEKPQDDNDEEDGDGDVGGGGVTDENRNKKRKERLEQNRVSARESRKRKKTMIEELQRTVITLSRENKELNDRNENLRRQLMEIGAKYPNLVPLQAVMGNTSAGSVVGAAGLDAGSAAESAAAAAVVQAAAAQGVAKEAAASNSLAAFPQLSFLAVQQQQLQQKSNEPAQQPTQQPQPSTTPA